MPSQEHIDGLFFSELVKQPLSVDSPATGKSDPTGFGLHSKAFLKRAAQEGARLDPQTDLERTFRHSGWAIERERVRRAMLTAMAKASRRERFDQCGGDCMVEWSAELKRHRLRANYCGDRFCIPCCRARAVKFRRRLNKLLGDDRPLFITLTLRNGPGDLSPMIDHLIASFRRLRQTKMWCAAIEAGVAVIENKIGKGGFGWHPHLHVLAVGKMLNKGDLAEAWKKATGGSFIVDVQRASKSDDAQCYVTKYVSKGWTAEVARDHDRLVECIIAMRGRRLLIPFGEWHGVDVDDDDPVADDWKPVGKLDHVLRAFARSEAWAIGVVRSLGCLDAVEKSNLLADPDG